MNHNLNSNIGRNKVEVDLSARESLDSFAILNFRMNQNLNCYYSGRNKAWGSTQLLVKRVGPRAGLEHRTPNPLHQKPPPPPAVQVERPPAAVPHHLPNVPAAAARPVQPLAQVPDLRRRRRVLAGVPRVDQRVRRKLRQLVPDHADHPVHSGVSVRRPQRRRTPAGHVRRHGEWVGAHLRALPAGVPDPRVRQRASRHRREGEVVEAADGAAEVLHCDAGGGEDEVDPVPVVCGEWPRPDGGGDDPLHREAREGGAVGAVPVGVLAGDDDGAGDVGSGLVGVEGDGAPPVGDAGGGSGAVVGDGEEEVEDEEALRVGPRAVPDEVELDGGSGEDGAHVVTEVDELRRALIPLGGREGSRRELGVAGGGGGAAVFFDGWVYLKGLVVVSGS
ncbi:glutaredoxin family protein [Striga asiatica]|uniref:Glutaredoxin family protein n=1 Tax=Striga asiatica TaxID=4170 RepID=A0A5A7RKG3_STRAF|nr:glutaredoxin family protein [Striga asiatica]